MHHFKNGLFEQFQQISTIVTFSMPQLSLRWQVTDGYWQYQESSQYILPKYSRGMRGDILHRKNTFKHQPAFNQHSIKFPSSTDWTCLSTIYAMVFLLRDYTMNYLHPVKLYVQQHMKLCQLNMRTWEHENNVSKLETNDKDEPVQTSFQWWYVFTKIVKIT